MTAWGTPEKPYGWMTSEEFDALLDQPLPECLRLDDEPKLQRAVGKVRASDPVERMQALAVNIAKAGGLDGHIVQALREDPAVRRLKREQGEDSYQAEVNFLLHRVHVTLNAEFRESRETFKSDAYIRGTSEYREQVTRLQARRLAERDFQDHLDQLEGDVEEFETIDLAEVEPEDSPGMDPTGTAYDKGKVWIAGEPGGGKTLKVRWLLLVAHVREAGRTVAIYECEMGPRNTRAMLEALGATPEEISKFKYYQYLGGGVADLTRHGKTIARKMQRDGASVLMYDAVAPLMMEAGLDEDKAGQVRRFINRSADPIVEQGGLVYFIDHTGNNSETGHRPRGSSDKKAGTDMLITLSVPKGKSFAKGHSGEFVLTVRKDRYGEVGEGFKRRVRVECGDDGSIRLRPGNWTAPISDDDKEKLSAGSTLGAALMQLRERGPLNKQDLERLTGIKAKTLYTSLYHSANSDKPKVRQLDGGLWEAL